MNTKNATAKKNAAPQTEAPAVALNPEIQLVTIEAPAAEDAPVAEAKRIRSYSQSAINTEDLERLNQLKTFVKEKLNVTISNQRIISAALACLGDNVEAFIKGIADEANAKQLAKERKAYLELKAKFDALDAPATAEAAA